MRKSVFKLHGRVQQGKQKLGSIPCNKSATCVGWLRQLPVRLTNFSAAYSLSHHMSPIMAQGDYGLLAHLFILPDRCAEVCLNLLIRALILPIRSWLPYMLRPPRSTLASLTISASASRAPGAIIRPQLKVCVVLAAFRLRPVLYISLGVNSTLLLALRMFCQEDMQHVFDIFHRCSSYCTLALLTSAKWLFEGVCLHLP